MRRWLLACALAAALVCDLQAGSALGETSVEAPEGRPAPNKWELALVPATEAGAFGWRVMRRSPGSATAYGYVLLRAHQGATVLGAFQREARVKPPYAGLGILIAARRVTAVSIDGSPPLATAPASGLPFGLRILSYEIPLASRAQAQRYVLGGLARLGLRLSLTAFDAQGQPLSPSRYAETEPLQTRSWEHPASRGPGACHIAARHLGDLERQYGTGLSPQYGAVLLHLRPIAGLSGRPFLSCANTTFQLGAQPLEAAALVDAVTPGARPVPIPGTVPVHGAAGVVESDVPWVPMVARRLKHGWLLLEGGASLQERLVVLEHLTATIELGAPAPRGFEQQLQLFGESYRSSAMRGASRLNTQKPSANSTATSAIGSSRAGQLPMIWPALSVPRLIIAWRNC